MNDRELQSLRNLGNESEVAADEIERLRAQVAERGSEIHGLRNVIQAACSGGTGAMLKRWEKTFPDAPVPTVWQMACGHSPDLMLHYAETGEPLYCELCDAQSGRRDAEKREAALEADNAALRAEVERYKSTAIALNVKHRDCHKAADEFWTYWREVGETHKHGYYESTWGAINRALRTVGVVPHQWAQKADAAIDAARRPA